MCAHVEEVVVPHALSHQLLAVGARIAEGQMEITVSQSSSLMLPLLSLPLCALSRVHLASLPMWP